MSHEFGSIWKPIEFPTTADGKFHRNLWEERSRKSVTMDLEFLFPAVDGSRLMTQICIRNAKDEEVINTTINHNCNVRELYKRNNGRIALLRAATGPPSDEPTPGKTIEEVANKLKEYKFGTDVYMIVWSSSFCDWTILYKSLKQIRGEGLMPPRTNVLRVNKALKTALREFKLYYSLSDIYRLLLPDDRELPLLAHTAGPDVLMTQKITNIYFQFTRQLLPLASVWHYLEKGPGDLLLDKADGLVW